MAEANINVAGAPSDDPVNQVYRGPVNKAELDVLLQKAKAKNAERRAKAGKYESPALNINSLMDIFTNILVYLILTYANDPITLNREVNMPKSNALIDPKQAVQMTITPNHILVNNISVVQLSQYEYSRDAIDAEGTLATLKDALSKAREKQQRFAAGGGSNFEGMINVIANTDMPAKLLLRVLDTAGQAEFGQYKLAVVKNK
ncbi:MAG: hypothetical protein GMKNLPBB_01671 [Myxococcota bacterium]|nr:hypothetical protein [Myxococcota bacterium]